MELRLRQVREQKGVTQTFMAQKLGFKSVSGYSAIERGLRRLDVMRAREIADILGVNMNELFFDEKLHITCNEVDR